MRGPIIWDNSLSIGHESIDRQHKSLFEAAEELRAAIQGGSKVSGALQCLDRLIGYIEEHFQDEEAYMRGIRYGRFDIQKKAHEEFVAKVHGFAETVDAGDVPYEEVLDYLVIWLTSHIASEDRLITASQGKPREAAGPA